jgi:hypothetical protein
LGPGVIEVTNKYITNDTNTVEDMTRSPFEWTDQPARAGWGCASTSLHQE